MEAAMELTAPEPEKKTMLREQVRPEPGKWAGRYGWKQPWNSPHRSPRRRPCCGSRCAQSQGSGLGGTDGSSHGTHRTGAREEDHAAGAGAPRAREVGWAVRMEAAMELTAPEPEKKTMLR